MLCGVTLQVALVDAAPRPGGQGLIPGLLPDLNGLLKQANGLMGQRG